MSLRDLSSINLASDPFRRERAQNATYALVCVVLLCSLLVITGLILKSRSQASIIRADIARQQSELRALRGEQGRYQAVLGKQSNADVFARSVFLNELIARRGVSWTRVFEDLTTVMPPTVRLEVIRLPQIPTQQAGEVNRVQLDLTLGADHTDALIDLLKRMASSPLFGAVTVVSQNPPTQNDPLYKCRLTVSYGQKL
jgi:type IV pilus assembly protein PilN